MRMQKQLFVAVKERLVFKEEIHITHSEKPDLFLGLMIIRGDRVRLGKGIDDPVGSISHTWDQLGKDDGRRRLMEKVDYGKLFVPLHGFNLVLFGAASQVKCKVLSGNSPNSACKHAYAASSI